MYNGIVPLRRFDLLGSEGGRTFFFSFAIFKHLDAFNVGLLDCLRPGRVAGSREANDRTLRML